MKLLQEVDTIRVVANKSLDPKKKGALGQFYTAAPIALFMASLFESIEEAVSLLDPGCGPCSLTAAFVDEAINRKSCESISVIAYDIEERTEPFSKRTLELCKNKFASLNGMLDYQYRAVDYILDGADNGGLFSKSEGYTHVIMNPPYKKIATSSAHRLALRAAGIETVNLYAGFVAMAIQQLLPGGELVAIIPRSFCNGPYYLPFRQLILKQTAITRIHIFDSRTNAFSGDDVLQENIIVHLKKGADQGDVTITSSPSADFHRDEESKSLTATDMTTRLVPFDSIIRPGDEQSFFHVAANNRDQAVIEKLSPFSSTLDDIGVQVSTGPVVGFRLRDDLRAEMEDGAVPLLYPAHLKSTVSWPLDSKKPNAIAITENTRKWLWLHKGHFVIVKRFSSKEERRRISASYYGSSLPGHLIGLDNKLNVFHNNKIGLDKPLALGLFVYLNSSLLDKFYRLFGGHTQVNATDLRNIGYPSSEILRELGEKVGSLNMSQKDIDYLVDEQLSLFPGDNNINPLNSQDKIDQAIAIIKLLDLPRAQQNERSALTLLSLLNLRPEGKWASIERPMIGVTPIMDWCRDVYGKEYAPNTRETFRRQTLHQFVDGGMVLYNPDQPDRAVNSPKACYQISAELAKVLSTYGSDKWESELAGWLKDRKTLASTYAMEREMQMVALTLDDGTEISLSPGVHSQLISDIVTEFGPRFAPGSEVIYLGDTGAKEDFFKKDRLAELGVRVNRKGKLPDVVLYWAERDWLLLIESVTSHGPVDGKRYGELSTLFKDAKPGLVYVTAFPSRRTMAKYLTDISWETEVWTSDDPTHLIHFNGDRFLGPYN